MYLLSNNPVIWCAVISLIKRKIFLKIHIIHFWLFGIISEGVEVEKLFWFLINF